MKIIVGLGNPGIPYRMTRHNIGFQVVDRLAKISHISIRTKRFKSLYGKGWIDSQGVVLLKPMTFMNRSGEAVKKAINLFHVETGDLIIIHDDMDLPFGRPRFKRRGGDGGHQGIRSIIDELDNNVFWRLKVGVGRPPKGMEPSEYVLDQFDETEKDQLDEILNRAVESLKVMLLEGIETAMNRYQRRGGMED